MEKKGNLLVIDDEIGPRESLRILFNDEYNVEVARSGEEGLEILNKQRFDLVILDLKMPGMGGIEVLKEIRSADSGIKVVVLTGYGSPETAKKVSRIGISAYLNKPFDISEIRELVHQEINGR